MRWTTVFFSLVLSLFATERCNAWNAIGHKTISKLAWDRMGPSQREAAYELLKQHPHVAEFFRIQNRPENMPEAEWFFLNASTWADWVRGNSNSPIGAYSHATWHYIDLPYIKPGKEEEFKGKKLDPPESNAVFALKHNHDILVNAALPAAERAVALTWMLHVVGDIHQPLHCVGLYSTELPKGDEGGNLFIVRDGQSTVKLHGYWDGLPGRGDSSIQMNFELLTRPEYGREKFADQLKRTQYMQWAEEGLQLAKTNVYLEGQLPGRLGRNVANDDEPLPPLTAEYAAQALAVARRQMALASFRMSDEMDAAFPMNKTLTRIGFGSCFHQDKTARIWDSIVAAKPELYLFLGDNIYGDTTDMQVMKAKYDKLAALPGYQQLLKTCPVLATWDDHDLGRNDAGADYPKRDESQQLFLDFFRISPDSPLRKQKGVYQAKVYGPPEQRVQVIMLDTRYFRGTLETKTGKGGAYIPSKDATKTMLGEEQWTWLREQLLVPAQLRVVVSSIQVVAEDHIYEKWQNLPHERQRLFDLIKDTKAQGVVMLSGDRHLAELSVMDAGIGYPLFDLTSSGLNQGAKAWRKLEENSHRVATMGYGNNFGAIEIDWAATPPLVRLQIRDEEGELTIQQKLPLSVLRSPAK